MDDRGSFRPARTGLRSTTYVSRDGDVARRYHDTGAWEDVVPSVDRCGRTVLGGNVSVASLVRSAWSPTYGRASGRGREGVGLGLRDMDRALRRAARVDDVANALGVQPSTAWSYVTKHVEANPRAHALASRLVYAPCLGACERVDASGPLRDVLPRVTRALAGDLEWYELEDRYAHLRLARVCLAASRLLEKNESM